MKKLALIFISISMIFTLTACVGGSESGDNSTDSEAVQEKEETEVSADFKSLMDEYEDFVDDYVEFMEDYSNSSDITAMLDDLTTYTDKYQKFTEKTDPIDAESLSEADYAYYTEVMVRCSKKLSNVAGSLL